MKHRLMRLWAGPRDERYARIYWQIATAPACFGVVAGIFWGLS